MTSQTSVPHASSWSQAARMMRAASSVLGGFGWGVGWRGFLAAAAGLLGIHSHRTAADSAELIAK